MMKKWMSLLLAAVLLTVVCASLCATLVSAEGEETESFTVEGAQKDVAIKGGDGFVAYFPNTTGADRKMVSGGGEGEFNLRWVYLLIFDGNGKLVGVGNNLLSKAQAEEKKQTFQNDLTVPAGGMLVVFDYFNGENDKRVQNQALFDYYKAAVVEKLDYDDDPLLVEGKQNPKHYSFFSNKTADVDSDFHAVADGEKLTFYKGAIPVVNPPAESTTSTADASSATNTSAPAASSAAGTSSKPATPPTGDAGLAFLAILGVIAVAGAAVAVRVRH